MIRQHVYECTIAASGTVSSEIDLGLYPFAPIGIEMPAGWDAANITFTGTNTKGGTFKALIDEAGNPLTSTGPAANEIVSLSGLRVFPVRYLKLVSSATQTAERALKLIGKVV